MGNAGLASFQASVIFKYRSNYATGLFVFMTTTASFVFMAACLCKYVSSRAAGSGLPELKAVCSIEYSFFLCLLSAPLSYFMTCYLF